ncbi:MAG: glycine dehydrogenase [Acidobacteria bacterium]|nr:MAG: glycine dehydrogenase [Acidobacteriota bacterium]
MRYLPKSPADREAILKVIGARSIDDLFAPIPEEYRLKRDLKVPRQMAESEIVEWFRERSRENGDGLCSFLGAGAYLHYRPVIIDALISRGEFLTAYTPYQAEISQGTLQAIFEFQTMICELLEELERMVTPKTACVLIQSPNFFGTIEDVAAIAEIAHRKNVLLVVSIAEAVSLGIVEPPRQADIVAMEAQSFGVPPSFGGPFCGIIATREQFVRQMPGRLAGQTVDREGRRGFVLTLATREQHIRREKATSNICTNQALVALMVNIFMTTYGKVGLRELAKQNLAKAAYAAQQFGKHVKVLFPGSPRFNEFVIATSEDPYAINGRMLGNKIVGGLPLKKFYPEFGNASLWCCTELTTRTAIDTAVGFVAESERSIRSAKEESVEEVAG